MRTLGIDLAAQRDGTGVCVIEWRACEAVATFPGFAKPGLREDPQLVSCMRECDFTAIDAPFGWPRHFPVTLRRWASEGCWDATPGTGQTWMDLGRRDTDLCEHARREDGTPPFAVGADKIATTAMRCARLLTSFYGEGRIERVKGPAFEAYPSAALREWRERGSGAPELDARTKWLDLFQERLGLGLGVEAHRKHAHAANGHGFDALVCAVVAKAAAGSRTYQPSDCDVDESVAAQEGWIHVPNCALGTLR